MSPIDYIKEGILEGNWETVCEGYERLTGEALTLPFPTTVTTPKDVENALRQISDIIVSVLDGPIVEICNATTKTKKRKYSKKKVKKKATVTKDGEDSSIQINDKDRTVVQRETGGIQFITNDPDPKEVEANKKKAERSRKNKMLLSRHTTRIYNVKCNECQESFNSNRPDGEMGQKCPKCLRNNKSRFV